MNSTKKFLAILMAVVMVLGLAACGAKPNTQETQAGDDVSDPRMIGMLVFSTDASVNINYDDQGLVLGIEGANAEGTVLAEAFPDCVGMTCNDLVVELLKKSAADSTLSTNVILKVSYGSQMPKADFLDTLVAKVEAAAEEASIVASLIAIPVDSLEESGYITADLAKTILLSKLGLQQAATLDSTTSPDANGEYMLYLEEGDLASTFMVNAVTGLVRELSEDELREMEGITGEGEIPVEEEENFDNLPTEEAEGNATEPAATEGTEPADATEATEATEAA